MTAFASTSSRSRAPTEGAGTSTFPFAWTLHLSTQQASSLGTWYLLGAVGGALYDHPLMAAELEQLGLPVKFGVPQEERMLMNLYPQPRGRQDSVEAFPEAPIVPGLPPGRERPRRRTRRLRARERT